MRKATYRDLAWDGLADVLRKAVETAGMSSELEPALAALRVRFDAAVDAVPMVARALDRLPDDQEAHEDTEANEDTVDPINRADDIAAQIGKTFNKK